ncbi:MAG: hypothetical protein NTY73_03445 [Candidatus Micrarchaeota archaeon]|nr:hypothetical protein [Candidatus Micrarchaeota archaeon]
MKERIKLKGRFKKADLFNQTLRIIIYPEDGLRKAVELQEIEEGEPVVVTVKKGFKYSPPISNYVETGVRHGRRQNKGRDTQIPL